MKHRLTPFDFALWAALPMAHTSQIEGRLTMILDRKRRRGLPRRALVFGIAVTAAALVPLAMLRPAAKAQPDAKPSPAKSMSTATARVSAVHAVPGEFDAMALLSKGRGLMPQAAQGLEKTLAAKPTDYAAHLQLLGYYGRGQFQADALGAAYQQQVFWMIQNHPESVLFSSNEIMLLKRETPAAFEQGKALWLAQVAKQPKNTVILGNAASYCLLSDDRTTEALLRQAQAVQPKSPVWPDKLGQFYRLQGEGPSPSPAVVRQSAIKALAEYEAAAALSTNKTVQHSTSADLAKTAFDAGEYEKASLYATRLLERGQNKEGYSWNPGGDIHEANLVLGRLALHDGDTAGAEAHLLAMGRVTGSPQLDSFGPNMQLAADLLKIGKRDTVLAYFDECGKFWKDKQLGIWRSEVEAGKMPNFRGNLDY